MLRKITNSLANFFIQPKEAAAALPPIPEPKVPNKAQTQPSASTRTKTSSGDIKLTATDRRTANLDLLTLRNGTTTKSTIRDLAQVSPDLSASVWAYQRLTITKEFTAVARNQDGTVNPQATEALQMVLARMNYLTDYAQGFNNISGIQAVGESLCRELRLYGACAQELVLDKARLPSRLQPISTTQITFQESTDGMIFPVQTSNGVEIPLDTPAFFYESLDQDLLTAYSDSPMESALAASLADAEFTQDVRRVIKRALHPRMDASIDSDAFRKSIPLELAGDEEGTRSYQDNFVSGIAETVNGLEPDDALVHLDMVKFDYLNNGNVSLDKEYTVLQGMINAKLATGTKAPPSVLGHGSGSANIASAEVQLFLKYVTGIQNKVNSIMSRSFTLALRLMGYDVYCQFAFAEVDLRPSSELAAFRAMDQSAVLELLSLGMISDEDASLRLTGHLPPKGYKPLSGTFFRPGATDPNAVQPVDAASAQNATGATEQTLTPDTPKAPKGSPANDPKQRTADITDLLEKTAALETRYAELSQRHEALGRQHTELEKQQYIAANKRPAQDPMIQLLGAGLLGMSAAKPEPQPANFHIHMPEGLVQMAAQPAANVQVDVHVPEAAAAAPAPAQNIQIDVHVPQQAAPVVQVTNEVQPSEVVVNNAFAKTAVQTVQRDRDDEIVSTTTTYEV